MCEACFTHSNAQIRGEFLYGVGSFAVRGRSGITWWISTSVLPLAFQTRLSETSAPCVARAMALSILLARAMRVRKGRTASSFSRSVALDARSSAAKAWAFAVGKRG